MRPVLGEWWMAGTKPSDGDASTLEGTVAGTFDDAGAGPWVLSTFGLLGDDLRSPVETQRGVQPPRRTLWGITNEHVRLSLLDCFLLRHPVVPRHARDGGQEWHTDCFVTGKTWVASNDEVDLIEIELDDLAAWAGDIGDFDSELDQGSQRVTASLQPHIISAPRCGAELRWRLGWPESGWGLRLMPKAMISITTRTTVGEIAADWARPLQRLFQLLCMRATRITRIAARLSDAADAADRIEVEMGQLADDERSDLQDIGMIARRSDMLATRRDLENADVSFDMLLDRYLTNRDCEPWHVALLHVLGSQNASSESSTEASFFDAVLAAEQLHRTVGEARQRPTSEHRERVRAILETCPPEYRDWLRQVLGTANRKSFATQLQEVVEAAGEVGQAVSAAWPKLSEYARDARNDTAHGNDFVRQETVNKYKGTELALQWIARRVLLEQLGMSPTSADALVGRTTEYRRALRSLEYWQAQLDFTET